MSAAALPIASRFARVSHWFGSSPPASLAVLHPDIVALPADADMTAARRETADQLYARIGTFLSAHDLAPTTDHFRIARGYVLGEDMRLTRAIDERLRDGGMLDAGFIERLDRTPASDRLTPEAIAELAEGLATQLARTQSAFRQGEASARDYSTALSAECDAAQGDPAGTMSRLLALTTAAIARTQQLADQLEANHRETERLRGNLREAQRAADEDHLTGLPNRRCFDTRMRALVAGTGDAPVHSVAICDIDNFKAINDRHGHDTGDRVLKLVARELTRLLGTTALVARHGGEEFACLFEHCTPQDALAKLDMVRTDLSGRQLVNQATGDGIGQLTFSAGIAALVNDPGAAMRTADDALYLAKRCGKNRVIVGALAGADQPNS